MAYEVGDMRRLSAAFTVSGTATNPTTITLLVKPPSGVLATYTYASDITRDSTGNYHYDLTFDAAGYWLYQWYGTGTVKASTAIVKIKVDPRLS